MADVRTFSDRVTLRLDKGVADVRLARPEQLNALDGAMFDALAEAIAAIPASGAHAVVLSGEGRGFCSGLDKAMFAQMQAGERPAGIPADLAERTHGDANLPQHVATGWRSLDVPVIAAVHGVAFGGGLQIALGADIRIVAPDARLGLFEMRWGLVPDMGAMALLPALMRDDDLRDILYTGREFDGQEAREMGIATRLSPDPLAAALDMAGAIARSSPAAMRAAKRLANLGSGSIAAILKAESEEQQKLIGGRISAMR
ncbi:Enoyl-CoA hydratase/isomerase [Sphingobium chlorophenolicum L-1]|uniref:Enoyl-CoA hydratase/isomerase n=1 Tax=Sphingobium chlorophenolicum L-1 TaxID=690566 RepID=F6F209_SPHCR|nr:crotonase/enoyl-CoA hydratase family protein [Sphingobium chlorophenolicum]AEG51575.1 Enoyl-CoA hydratase/isomerase [Sphingobium chlorophenolicum L-1]